MSDGVFEESDMGTPQGGVISPVLANIYLHYSLEVYVIGEILDDKTVKGGTGWGAEFAKLCNKPLYVFDPTAVLMRALIRMQTAWLLPWQFSATAKF